MSQAGGQNQSCWLVPSFIAFCAQSRASTSQLPSFRPGLSALPGSATTIHHGQTVKCQRVDYRTKPGPFSSGSLPLVPPCPQPFPAVLASLCFLDEDLRRGPRAQTPKGLFGAHKGAPLYDPAGPHSSGVSGTAPPEDPRGHVSLPTSMPLPLFSALQSWQCPSPGPTHLSFRSQLLGALPNPSSTAPGTLWFPPSGLRTYLLYGNCCCMPERAGAISPLSAVPPGVAAVSEDTALPLWASKALSPLSHIGRDALGAAHFSASFQL